MGDHNGPGAAILEHCNPDWMVIGQSWNPLGESRAYPFDDKDRVGVHKTDLDNSARLCQPTWRFSKSARQCVGRARLNGDVCGIRRWGLLVHTVHVEACREEQEN